MILTSLFFFFFQAEDGIRDAQESRGLGDVYKRQGYNYLVETADQKIPTTGLGSSTGWMTSTSSGDGHIPRNMRLCALVSELVEPYVRFSRTSQHSATDPDHLPQVESGSQVVVKWLVGGGFSISSTHVMWTRLNDQEATIACATKARMAAGFWSERVNSTDESSQLNGSNSWTEDGISQTLSLIHISEPTRLLSISYAVFCLKKKKKQTS
eukprot:TRINITY_DN1172_c0_g1_i9.p1 TRINITY_DN1172_c0_g1~~TRINITY_DN1172_c0_g1_i9.p1  ORF type:complete len:211 (-),score=53.09 TRINITY_DN1172_c0_g1_i9:108-740(-)